MWRTLSGVIVFRYGGSYRVSILPAYDAIYDSICGDPISPVYDAIYDDAYDAISPT
jgi:hypothetical protein